MPRTLEAVEQKQQALEAAMAQGEKALRACEISTERSVAASEERIASTITRIALRERDLIRSSLNGILELFLKEEERRADMSIAAEKRGLCEEREWRAALCEFAKVADEECRVCSASLSAQLDALSEQLDTSLSTVSTIELREEIDAVSAVATAQQASVEAVCAELTRQQDKQLAKHEEELAALRADVDLGIANAAEEKALATEHLSALLSKERATTEEKLAAASASQAIAASELCASDDALDAAQQAVSAFLRVGIDGNDVKQQQQKQQQQQQQQQAEAHQPPPSSVGSGTSPYPPPSPPPRRGGKHASSTATTPRTPLNDAPPPAPGQIPASPDGTRGPVMVKIMRNGGRETSTEMSKEMSKEMGTLSEQMALLLARCDEVARVVGNDEKRRADDAQRAVRVQSMLEEMEPQVSSLIAENTQCKVACEAVKAAGEAREAEHAMELSAMRVACQELQVELDSEKQRGDMEASARASQADEVARLHAAARAEADALLEERRVADLKEATRLAALRESEHGKHELEAQLAARDEQLTRMRSQAEQAAAREAALSRDLDAAAVQSVESTKVVRRLVESLRAETACGAQIVRGAYSRQVAAAACSGVVRRALETELLVERGAMEEALELIDRLRGEASDAADAASAALCKEEARRVAAEKAQEEAEGKVFHAAQRLRAAIRYQPAVGGGSAADEIDHALANVLHAAALPRRVALLRISRGWYWLSAPASWCKASAAGSRDRGGKGGGGKVGGGKVDDQGSGGGDADGGDGSGSSDGSGCEQHHIKRRLMLPAGRPRRVQFVINSAGLLMARLPDSGQGQIQLAHPVHFLLAYLDRLPPPQMAVLAATRAPASAAQAQAEPCHAESHAAEPYAVPHAAEPYAERYEQVEDELHFLQARAALVEYHSANSRSNSRNGQSCDELLASPTPWLPLPPHSARRSLKRSGRHRSRTLSPARSDRTSAWATPVVNLSIEHLHEKPDLLCKGLHPLGRPSGSALEPLGAFDMFGARHAIPVATVDLFDE